MSSIRSAEFLLATIKLALGIEILVSVLGRRGTLSPIVAVVIALAFLLIAALQLLGVLKNWVRYRQVASLIATFVWFYFVGLVWVTAGTPMGVLVYIPLLVFNIMLFTRLSRLPRSGERGKSE